MEKKIKDEIISGFIVGFAAGVMSVIFLTWMVKIFLTH